MRNFQLTGHIGANVSALVDGQLSDVDSERAWSHVFTCTGCRRLVEREGWTKTRLQTLAHHEPPAAQQTPSGLLGALYDVEAWAHVDEIERVSRRRRAATALVGVGGVGVAVLGLVAVTSPPVSRDEIPGSPAPAMVRSELVGSTFVARQGHHHGEPAPAPLVRRAAR